MTKFANFGCVWSRGGCFGAGFGLYLRVRCFMLKKFVLGGMVVVAALFGNACGDDGSNDSPAAPADSELTLSSSNDAVSSSSEKNEAISSSHLSSSSSEKAVGGSSSSDGKTSSSSGNVESSSSGKGEKSSSSEGAAGSSSSEVVAESSSSEKSSSSVAESSSSVESSSSEERSSSSVVESSSSVAESSSSLETKSSSSIALSSSSETPTVMSIYDAENNTLTDLRDNHVYKTVTIGTQVWMAQNIDYLPEDTTDTKYGGSSVCGGGTTGTFNEGDCAIYGRLYLRKVLIDSVGDGKVVCPDGWIVPTLTHWKVLIEYLGGESVAGKKMKLDDDSMWGGGMEHSNEFGFSATLASYYNIHTGFNDIKDYNRTSMLVYPIDYYSGVMNTKTIYDDEDEIKDLSYLGDSYAISVRCIKK